MKKLFSVLLSIVLCLSAASFACADDAPLTLSAPSGAPALAVAVLAEENPEAYTFVAADTIAAEFAAAKADFIIAPLNAGAKLFKAGKSAYQLAAVVTWGNLFIATQKEGFRPEDLNGSKLVLFGENTINASVTLFALKENGIVPGETEYLAGAANTQALLLSDPEAVVVTAEPALTAAMMKNDKITAFSVNSLYEKATGFQGYTQAALFVNPETAKARPEDVKNYLAQVQASCEKCESDIPAVAKAAVALTILPNQKVAEKAIPGCAIRFAYALDAKEQVERTANVDLSQFGGAVPADEFYYTAE